MARPPHGPKALCRAMLFSVHREKTVTKKLLAGDMLVGHRSSNQIEGNELVFIGGAHECKIPLRSHAQSQFPILIQKHTLNRYISTQDHYEVTRQAGGPFPSAREYFRCNLGPSPPFLSSSLPFRMRFASLHLSYAPFSPSLSPHRAALPSRTAPPSTSLVTKEETYACV